MNEPIEPERSALLLIDLQHDFLADDGRMPVARHQVEPMLAAARAAIDVARRRGMLIVQVANAFSPDDRLMNFFRHHAAIANSPGAAWDPRVAVAGAPTVFKQRGDAFSNPDLEKLLRARGIRHVVLAGLMARACISATARGAMARGFTVSAIAPAIACAGDGWRAWALRRLARRHVRLVDALDFGAPAAGPGARGAQAASAG